MHKLRPAASKESKVSKPRASYAEDYGPKTPNRTKISYFSAENSRNNPHPKEVSYSLITIEKWKFSDPMVICISGFSSMEGAISSSTTN